MAKKKEQEKAEIKGKVRATFYINRELFTSLKVLVHNLQGEAIKRGELGRSRNQSELVEEGINIIVKKYMVK
jgi:hypothetical protein